MSATTHVSTDLATAQAARAARTSFRLFVRNVTVLVAVGVAISWWLVEFTDFFPTIGGLLGLGGIFAWAAFLSNLIREDRKKEMQQAIETKVLLVSSTTLYALLVLMLFVVCVAMRSTIIVIGPPDGEKRVVELRSGNDVIETINVGAGEKVKRSIFVPLQNNVVVAKVVGLPETNVRLEHFGRQTLAVPYSFTSQPTLLAVLPSSLVTSAREATIRILRKRGDAWMVEDESTLPQYNGRSIWVGCSADVKVPAPVITQWQSDGLSSAVVKRLRDPVATTTTPLESGTELRVCVANGAAGIIASGETTVAGRGKEAFPQQLVLDEGDDAGRCKS